MLSSSDALRGEALMGSAPRVVVGRARTLREAALKDFLEHFDFQRPDLELEGCARSDAQFKAVLPEAVPQLAYVPDNFDGQVGVMVDVPPEVSEVVHTWPAASMLNVAAVSGNPLFRKHTISFLASETLRPNAAHAVTITTIIFLSCSGACKTSPVSSADSMSHTDDRCSP